MAAPVLESAPTMGTRICFDLPHLYYLPQYQPVVRALRSQGVTCVYVAYRQIELPDLDDELTEQGARVHWVENVPGALAAYHEQQPDWVVFGNGFEALAQLPRRTRSALVYHASGTGFKTASLHPAMAEMDVRFVSGPARLGVFREHFPGVELVEVGFAKLDPLFAGGDAAPRFDLRAAGLEPARPTILYAPTFYPSSIERLPRHWPDDFAHCNLLLKAHDFTWRKRRYAAQRRRLQQWRKHANVYVAEPREYSLLPFMGSADLLASDRSSAVFEFIALDKPALICDFVKLRWTYRGPFRARARKRLDPPVQRFEEIATHVARYADLAQAVRRELREPTARSAERRRHTDQHMGRCDGRAGERIAAYLLAH